MTPERERNSLYRVYYTNNELERYDLPLNQHDNRFRIAVPKLTVSMNDMLGEDTHHNQFKWLKILIYYIFELNFILFIVSFDGHKIHSLLDQQLENIMSRKRIGENVYIDVLANPSSEYVNEILRTQKVRPVLIIFNLI